MYSARRITDGSASSTPAVRCEPTRLAEHISLIDMPYCGLAPFPFDLAFLASWLRFLLPEFDSRTRRDIVLDSYRAVIEEVRTGVRPGDVPADGVRFVNCVSTILGQVRLAQPSMGADIENAFLACLAAASLWQAIKLRRPRRTRSGCPAEGDRGLLPKRRWL